MRRKFPDNKRLTNAAAATVILLAGALSAIWAFVVPIFQAPDEPAHFDYAMSIYGAHRLIRLSDGRPDWIASPYTAYLLHAADFGRIAQHSSMRVPSGYGTRGFFARIDAGAPSVHSLTPPQGRISYIVPLYPFGFYALEALWMHAVGLFTGSLTALFFAARLLCVFLMMGGLYFNYRTALNLGLARWTSVALIAAIGFFPLTSFVSSYVQPDNLAYALTSAALFLATKLQRQVLRYGTLGALGLFLGLLAVTKLQFFVSAAIPILFYCAVRFTQLKRPVFQPLLGIAWLLAPTILLVAVQRLVVDQSGLGGQADVTSGALFDFFHGVIASGPAAAVHAVFANGINAVTDFFISGACAATYWQVVGWVDTPIVIFNDGAEAWIRALISLGTIAVFIILAFFLSRNALRLVSAAMRGHLRQALAVAAADPVLNSYVCIVALLVALYIVSNNAFGAEGRHWFPYVFPAFLCFAWYAPRALNRQHARLSALLTCTLLGYAVVASAYAFSDVLHRYYGPSSAPYVAGVPHASQIVPGTAAGALRPVQTAAYHVNSAVLPSSFGPAARLLVTGAVLPTADNVDARVAVVLDQHRPIPVVTAQFDFRVAEVLRSVAAGYSGFYGYVAATGLREGAHAVTAYAILDDGRAYQRVTPTRLFFLTPSGGRFSGAFLRELDATPVVKGNLVVRGACAGGARVLLSGTITDGSPSSYSAIWLLVDGKPYPARYDAVHNEFDGTVQAPDPPDGLHRAAAYALSEGVLGYRRISETTSFRAARFSGRTWTLGEMPASCDDASGD